MSNPFAGVGVPDGNSEIQGLVDQAVILQSALVPKLPEIGITDGMIPIIDQIYPDSGSASIYRPGTTINFNFGNSHGKLVDWTQSKLHYTAICKTSYKYTAEVDAPKKGGDGADANDPVVAKTPSGVGLGSAGITLCMRHGGMMFSQVTFGGAGRPITINDFEMVCLARSLLTTAESNVTSHIGDISTHDWIGCGTTLPNLHPEADQTSGKLAVGYTVEIEVPIKVTIPLTTIMPMFGTVDNYLLSTTSGIELRLTLTSNPNVLCWATESSFNNQSATAHDWKHLPDIMAANPCLGMFKTGPLHITKDQLEKLDFEYPYKGADGITLTAPTIERIENVRIDLISTQHPDDYILNMLNNICSTRGLFYPNQMFIATPFNCTIKAQATQKHYAFLVPVVSGYRNIDAVFCWFTKPNDPNILQKLPVTNIYTSLNGTFKMPVHGYQDHTYDVMTETAAQFNRCFGTINSTLLSPMKDIMQAYKPHRSGNGYANCNITQGAVIMKATDTDKRVSMRDEQKLNDTFIMNATMWELEKSSWMNGPDFSQHSNKYQIVFDIEWGPEQDEQYTFWVIQRFDAYTHVYNGYVNLLTTKEEVAMALAQAQAGQAVTR